MLQAEGLERKGNCSVSRIFKGGFTRGGRRTWEDVCSTVEEAVETQGQVVKVGFWWEMTCKGQWSLKYGSPKGCGTDGLGKTKAFLHELGNCWLKCEEDLKKGNEQLRCVGYSWAGRKSTDLAKRRRKQNREGKRNGRSTSWVWEEAYENQLLKQIEICFSQ